MMILIPGRYYVHPRIFHDSTFILIAPRLSKMKSCYSVDPARRDGTIALVEDTCNYIILSSHCLKAASAVITWVFASLRELRPLPVV